jgi:hypothetical protein
MSEAVLRIRCTAPSAGDTDALERWLREQGTTLGGDAARLHQLDTFSVHATEADLEQGGWVLELGGHEVESPAIRALVADMRLLGLAPVLAGSETGRP